MESPCSSVSSPGATAEKRKSSRADVDDGSPKKRKSSPTISGTVAGIFHGGISLLRSAARDVSVVTLSSASSRSGASSPESLIKDGRSGSADASGGESGASDGVIEIQSSDDDDSVVCISEKKVAAKKPAAKRSAVGDADGQRRSARERQSTVVYIDGHAVLKENNYVVKGGEYSYGAFTPAAPTRKPAAATRLSNSPKKPARKPRVLSEAEKKRSAYNDWVKKRVADKDKKKRAFLAKNVDVLAPFIEGSVESSLRTLAAKNKRGVSADDDWVDMNMQPDMIQADMRDYQLIGVNWMAKMHSMNLGMILGDEMGLGKTLQTIALLAYLKENDNVTGPSLVICPLSVLYSWCNELEKWAPDLKFLRLHSSCLHEREAQRAAFMKEATEYDVVVTTYEMAKNPALTSLWSRQHFNYLILDEGHKIKNHESQIAQGVRHIHCENKLILTGTPLQNNLVELWSLLNFLYPDIFTVSKPFSEAFDIAHNAIDNEKLHMAHDLLDIFMIRRMKTEVEKLMPPKIETRVICPLSATQIFWYKAILLKDIRVLARVSEKLADGTEKPVIGASTRSLLSNLVMQLRKCCLHPYLFDGAEDIDSTSCEDLIAASGKLAVLDELLRSLFAKGHRVVLFSQFTSMLDIIDDYCNMRSWKYCRFDGGTPRARRNFTVNQFNSPDSDCFIFLMSTRAGGMGLNLQTADTCILFDSDWNPQPDIQAMARVHRIGQKKTVHVYRLVSGGTVEERIVDRAEKKLYLDKMVNRGADVDNEEKVEGLSTEELLSSLKFGCNAIFGDASQNMLPSREDIEMITDRKRTEDFSAGKLKGGVTQTAKDFDANIELKSTTKFGGVDFKTLRDEQQKKKVGNIPSNLRDVAVQWSQVQEQQKRERKSRILMVKGKGSGYGSAYVPVLASNNYELESGESSVFSRELGGREGNYGESKTKRLKAGVDFDNQDFCQVCGDGGTLICCPNCPVSLHVHCAGVRSAKEFMTCSHHRCSVCHKDWTSAGGILFPCQSCPHSFCEDCLPKKGVRLLKECDRFENLGYDSTRKFAYIHCSKQCEEVAIAEFGWSMTRRTKPVCPTQVDVSYNFGKEIDEKHIGGIDEGLELGSRRKKSTRKYKH